MNSALAALVTSAAGTGAPLTPSSRYYGAATLPLTQADGTSVVYLARRIVPQPGTYGSTRSYVVIEGDRLDNLASRFLGDPLLFWMICDANGATDPESLTAQPGRTIRIPIAAGLAPGARNG